MELTIKVDGMMCNHCKARVEKACASVSGVERVVVDLKEKTVSISGDVIESDVKKAIVEVGYKVNE